MTGSDQTLQAARLDHLPGEILLQIFSRLTRPELVLSLPLVCRAFSELLSLPNHLWAESYTIWAFTTFPAMVDGPKLCSWLAPRLQGLTKFRCPLGGFLPAGSLATPGYRLAADLFNVLPASLTHVNLQGDSRLGFDNNWGSRKAQAYSDKDFELHLDVLPFLSALTRLSNLQSLALPLLAELSPPSLQCLAGLKTLQNLSLIWRQTDSTHLHQPGLAWQGSFPVMASLTALTLRGLVAKDIPGAALLPCLHKLTVGRSGALSLLGVRNAQFLVILEIEDVTLTEPGPSLADTLMSLPHLKTLHINKAVLSMGRVQIASLLKLPCLEELLAFDMVGMERTEDPSPGETSPHLTSLSLDTATQLPAKDIPGLEQLFSLQDLWLNVKWRSGTCCLPMGLSCLASLKNIVLHRTGWNADFSTFQLLDITALSMLGPAMESVVFQGKFRLVTACSLLPLAAGPMLRRFYINQCQVATTGRTWLHMAALLHALLQRPQNGLPAVQMQPAFHQI